MNHAVYVAMLWALALGVLAGVVRMLSRPKKPDVIDRHPLPDQRDSIAKARRECGLQVPKPWAQP